MSLAKDVGQAPALTMGVPEGAPASPCPLLRRHLTEDQRAMLALKWQRRASAQAQSEAGKRAVAVRDGRLDEQDRTAVADEVSARAWPSPCAQPGASACTCLHVLACAPSPPRVWAQQVSRS